MTQIIIMPRRDDGKKRVPARQSAIDALPLDSGDWKVDGIPGLVVRCGARAKSFRLVRRVAGQLVKRVLGEISLAEARRQAMTVWRDLRPRVGASQPAPTLAEALEAYLAEKTLAPHTVRFYRGMVRTWLADLLGRRLDVIAMDRAGMRARIARITRERSPAAAAAVLRTFRAIYNWHRKVYPDMPECPTVACETPTVRPRDWALSDDELRAWWQTVRRLEAAKRTWWLTALLTGARAGSITALRWDDIDFERRLIRFRVTKGNRPYTIPMVKRLAAVLEDYRAHGWLPNDGDWVFPSPVKPGARVRRWGPVAGIRSPHSMRHTMRTRLAEVGATPDLARIALGHSMTGDVSSGYITTSLLLEAVRPLMEAVSERYGRVLGWDSERVG